MDDSKNAQCLSRQAGRLAGEAVRRYLSVERVMKTWLISRGVNATVCTWVFLILKLGLTGLALYVSFWIAATLFGLWLLKEMAVAGLNSKATDTQEGWDYGHSGFGYYINGYRVDPGRDDDE
ncbi:hypothetical protein M2401_003850 [Pseudomonas sp. JUb42]|uniref:DUF3742 family protein n=1 Tax=Pseudomonas sp. JUb42 TaxID=2940611 RepID=UPI002168540E|nr:DUF3742 family protein [Pseudomonas sp. JUb42]MCS3470100.1 hypothetical protein [Pseudomonas sp. JUb42]